MTKIARHALLALSFLSGLVPALAAPPPPVPALPDTARTTTYTPTASTGPFNVSFDVYGDSTDYGTWVEVWVNGSKLTPVTQWTLTSPSGPLNLLPRPITNAQVTLTTAATGTVQIVGARRPRRTSQFPENRGVTARDFNQVLSDLTAVQREAWDLRTRALLGPPGASLGFLPPAASCIGKFLGFDGTGANPVCAPGGAGSGNVVGPMTSTVGHLATFNSITGALLNDLPVVAGQLAVGQSDGSVLARTISGAATINTSGAIALTAGAASANVGALANDLSGTLPSPTVVSANNGFAVKAGDLTVSQPSGSVEIGAKTSANTPHIDFNSSGANIDYDARLIGTGGNGTLGTGNIFALGTLVASPKANSLIPGFMTQQSGAGTLGTNYNCAGTSLGQPFGYCYNAISVNDAVNGPLDQSYTTMALGVRMATGGATVEGTRTGVYAENVLTAATSATNANRFYAGGGFVARAQSNDGGSPGAWLGALFGGYSAALVDAGIQTHFANVTSFEYGMSVPSGAGSTIGYKSILQLASMPADQVHGSLESMIALSANSGSIGWNNGIIFTSGNGQQPITTTGCLICAVSVDHFAGTPTIGKGIDISGYRPTGNAFASNGFAVAGTGQITNAGGGWATYTPTVGCGGGSATWGTVIGRWQQIGKGIRILLDLTMTAVGTCTGSINASLPSTPANKAVLSGGDFTTGVGAVYGRATSASVTMIITNAAGFVPASAGMNAVLSGQYEIP